MFKWFWTIFSSGAPEKLLGNICSFKQLFYSKKSLGAPERESELRSCEERERKTTCFSLSLPLHGSLSLSRRKFEEKPLELRYVTHRTLNDPSVNSRVGFPYGSIWATARKGHGGCLREPLTEIFRTNWYLTKMIYFKRAWGRALPYGIKRCWVSLPPPPSPLGLDTCDSPFPGWSARIWKGNDCYTGCYIPFPLFHSFPSEANTIVGKPKTLERMLSSEPQAPVVTLIIKNWIIG